ncbi:MAG: beta-ketoacyl-[acyl-carrier-protein] synthase family protein [Thermodesulfobacteriota bacterium]
MSQVYVTGMGVHCAGGRNEAEFTKFLRDGGCALNELSRVDTSELYARHGGEVSLPRDDFSSPDYRDLASKLSFDTARMALENADLDLNSLDPYEIGLILGVTCGGMDSQEEWVRRDIAGEEKGRAILEESLFHAMSNNLAASYDIRGPVSTVTIACAAGTNAIGYGYDLIRQGKAKVVLVGGVDVVTQLTFSGFCALKAMSPDICRPFDTNNNGIALGDGCGILVLEEGDFALGRGARLRAEVLGYGACNDGFHGTTPSPVAKGLLKSINHAASQAGVAAADIEYVNLHGTGTDGNDNMEAYAIGQFFGAKGPEVPVSSIKSSIGHTLGAAGAVETIATIVAMENDFLPPSVNVTEANPELKVNLVANKAHKRPMNCFMNVNSAFAGNNAAVVMRKPGSAVGGAPPLAPERTRIAITGLGLVLPGLSGADELWDSLLTAEVVPAGGDDTAEPGEFATFSFCKMSGMKNSMLTRQMDRYAAMSVLAALQAFDQAEVNGDLLEEAGSVVGSGYGSLAANTKFFRTVAEKGNSMAKPVLFQKTVSNTASGFISILAGARGFNTTLNNGDVSGLEAVRYAHHLLHSGKADVIYAGGVDARAGIVTDIFQARGNGLEAQGEAAPFCPDSPGARITEGASGLVLEPIAKAKARGAEVLGEILGWGQAFAGRDASLSDTVAKAMADALAESGLGPADIDLVIAHGNGNPVVDQAEWQAVEQVFATERVFLTSLKAKVGEAMGAGGVCSLTAALMALRDNTIFGMGPAVAHESETIMALQEGCQVELNHVLVNAIDQTGAAISLVVRGVGADL